MIRILSLLISMVLAGSIASSGQQQSRFEDVTDVVVVEVPVQVIKDGQPVRGLTAENFQILDGGKKRDLIGFDVMDLTLTDPQGRPATVPSAAARRHFPFFFDLSFSDPGAIVRARQAATDLVDTALHPSDLVAVASYSRATGARLVIGFTPDRMQAKFAIDTLGLPQLVEAKRDPLGLILSDERDSIGLSDTPGIPIGGGDSGRPDPEAEIKEVITRMVGAERQATNRNEILALTGALTEFTEFMKNIEGRKYVVYLSEGFDSSILLGARGSTAAEQKKIQEANEAAMSGRYWEVDSDERFGNTDMQNQLTQMLQGFIRADCTIQAVDIGGLAAGGAAVVRQSNTQDSLFIMANDTGGEFYANFNNPKSAMDSMLERTSVTYVLAFQHQDLKNDGKFHKLKVKLVNGPKGTRLVHRPGYFAAKEYGEMNRMERQLAGASAIMGAAGGLVDSSVLAAPFNVGATTAYVPVLIEIDGSSLMTGTSGNVLPTEIYAYAITSQGTVRDFFVEALALDLSKAGAALEQTGFKYFGHFDLPADEYEIRTMVRNGSTGATGVATSRVRVPDFDQAETLVLPPLFPEPAGKWLMGREDPSRQGDYPYPFIEQGAAYIPAARPAVRSGQAANISLVTYNMGVGVPDVKAAIFDLAGNRLGDVAIVLDRQESGEDPAMIRFGGTCEIPSVGQGLFKLEVTLEDPATGDPQTSAIDLQVVG